MSSDPSTWVGRRLSIRERLNWRFVVAIIGATLIVVAYFLPMFTHHIVHATTRFSGGTVVEKSSPVMVSGQHYVQAQHPVKEQLTDVTIRTVPVSEHRGSGWAWLLQVASRREYLFPLASYLISLLVPLLAAALLLGLTLVSWFGKNGLAEYLIPSAVAVSLASGPALVLAWLHQFDFSSMLYGLTEGLLAPRIGFWLALVGCIVLTVAAISLRRGTRRDVVNWWALVFATVLLIWLLVRFRPYPFLEIWNFVSDGILVTLRIVVTSFGLILLVSLLGGMGRISRSPIIHGLASLYVEIVRGIPLLVQLLFIWFALPQVFDALGDLLLAISPALAGAGNWLIDLRLNAFTAAVLGLTVCYGAYGSEIFRAGISSIHSGQMEAARSLGMTYLQAMRHVILPQAVRVILPPIGNEFVALLKDSTLVSVLAVSDLTRRGREYMARTFLSFDTWILVALCYLALTVFSSRVVEFIEEKSRFERST